MNINIFSYFLYTQDGLTPLSLACGSGLSDVAQLLINKGASFDVTDEVSYYLYINNLNSSSHFCDLLYSKSMCEYTVLIKIFSYFLYTQYGHTPLFWACDHGLSDVAQLLIKKGASFNLTDEVSYYLCIK